MAAVSRPAPRPAHCSLITRDRRSRDQEIKIYTLYKYDQTLRISTFSTHPSRSHTTDYRDKPCVQHCALHASALLQSLISESHYFQQTISGLELDRIPKFQMLSCCRDRETPLCLCATEAYVCVTCDRSPSRVTRHTAATRRMGQSQLRDTMTQNRFSAAQHPTTLHSPAYKNIRWGNKKYLSKKKYFFIGL